MKEGKRILADPKFNILDGTWDDRDIAKCKHALYGIVIQDLYSHYKTGDHDYPVNVPDHVCDRRYKNKPVRVRMRHKEQAVMGGILFPFKENPNKIRHLFKWIVDEINKHRNRFGVAKLNKDGLYFRLEAFTTISSTGHICLWKITTKTKDVNNQPVKFPILQEIDKIDACNFTFKEMLKIAGIMTFDECDMERKEYTTMACKYSKLTRNGRNKK